MKILLCISTLKSGGAEKNISFLGNYLAKNNDVTILTFDGLHSEPFYKIDKRIKVINLNLQKENTNFFLKIKFFLRELKL